MDTAYLSAVAALAGSALGGFTSLGASWLTQRVQVNAQRLTHELSRQEEVYKDFIDEASSAFADALEHSEADPAKLVRLYALVSRMRVLSSEPVVEQADAVMRTVLETYHAPNVLLSYPKEKPAGLEEHFYWLCYNLDGRPNYTLRQRMALSVGEVFAVADREFYVSHGYSASQAVAGFIPVPEGTMVVHQSRVSTDQVAGFTSSMKKGIGRSVMARQLTGIFERSRESFQQRRSVLRSQ